jgi:hypothetical protein
MRRLILFPTNSFSGAFLNRLLNGLKRLLFLAGRSGRQCHR